MKNTCNSVRNAINPIKPIISYLIHSFLRPQNDQYTENLLKKISYMLIDGYGMRRYRVITDIYMHLCK